MYLQRKQKCEILKYFLSEGLKTIIKIRNYDFVVI